MADTKVENESNEVFRIDGDEYMYMVDDPSGTPIPSKVASRVFDIWGRSNRDYQVSFMAGFGTGAITIGASAATQIGTDAGGNSWASTNEKTRRKRGSKTTGTTAGTAAGWRCTSGTVIRSTVAGDGGFVFMARFGLTTLPASWRAFIGLNTNFGAPANADPSAMLNMIGLAKDSADSAWQIMSNDGSGTATKVALNTTDFPINNTSDVFEVMFYCPPGNAPNVTYRVRRITSKDSNGNDVYAANPATGTISTDLPSGGSTVLNWNLWINNDVNNAAAVIDPIRVYMESLGAS